MGETRVDLLHLLEDLRDAYPGAIEETTLTEIVANSLDSGASEIALATDPAATAFLGAWGAATDARRRRRGQAPDRREGSTASGGSRRW